MIYIYVRYDFYKTNVPENVRILGNFLSRFCQDCQDIGVAQGGGHPV